MSQELIVRKAGLEDINRIGYLAYEIWPAAYKEILGLEQLQYMLNLGYSPQSLHQQMTRDQQTFLLALLNEEPVGYASYAPMEQPHTYKLHKLYLRNDIQGKGLGKSLLEAVEQACLALGGTELHLNVNRHNNARHFYERQGFRIYREVDIEIGNGFYMNDYLMVKPL